MASFLAACGGAGGDDDGGDDGDDVAADASLFDGAPPDSAEPTATRSATIAIAEVALTSPNGVAGEWRGGSISILFDDLASSGGQVVYGTSTIGGCVVTRYDAEHPPYGTVDAGTITLGGDGIQLPISPCKFFDDGSYGCAAADGTEQTAFASPTAAGLVIYAFTEQDFTGKDLIGSYLKVRGFSYAGNNGSFPIIAQPGPQSVTVLNPYGEEEGVGTPVTSASFAILNGGGPVPESFDISGDFLGDATSTVTISKPDDPDWGSIDLSLYPRGEGLVLDTAGDHPHEFPQTARDMGFACGDIDGDCGADGADAPMEAMVITGRTTDASVTSTPADYVMPDPVSTWATFQCAFPNGTYGPIPSAAVQAILDTNPTRIETRVLMVSGAAGTGMDANNELNSARILVGHGLVGHTTMQ